MTENVRQIWESSCYVHFSRTWQRLQKTARGIPQSGFCGKTTHFGSLAMRRPILSQSVFKRTLAARSASLTLTFQTGLVEHVGMRGRAVVEPFEVGRARTLLRPLPGS